jgi:hypothetical protein
LTVGDSRLSVGSGAVPFIERQLRWPVGDN